MSGTKAPKGAFVRTKTTVVHGGPGRPQFIIERSSWPVPRTQPAPRTSMAYVIISCMHRLIAVLLLLLMPVQFAFAAAAPYCAMEKVETPPHLGHHEHVDDTVPAQEDGKGDASLPDNCSICHLASAQPTCSTPSPGAPAQAALPRARPDDRQPQHLVEPTERPPLTSLA